MERHVGTIKAIRDNGQFVYIEEYQEFIDATSFGDATRNWVPGMKRLELRDGGAVNFIDDETFEIVSTGERVSTKRPK